MRVIHNGVSERFRPGVTPEEQAAARAPLLSPGAVRFWVGDFRPEKNLSFLIHAWSRLRHHMADPPVLVLAGAQRGEYRKLRKEVEKRGLEDKVLFPGFIRDDDLPAVYSAATLFVFPSLYEGFGLPPLEAMACGTPCVVSNSSSLPEVTGSAALLFNPTSLDSLRGLRDAGADRARALRGPPPGRAPAVGAVPLEQGGGGDAGGLSQRSGGAEGLERDFPRERSGRVKSRP